MQDILDIYRYVAKISKGVPPLLVNNLFIHEQQGNPRDLQAYCSDKGVTLCAFPAATIKIFILELKEN